MVSSMENLDFRTKHAHLLWDMDNLHFRAKHAHLLWNINSIEFFDLTLRNVRFLSVRAEIAGKKLPHGSPGPRKDQALSYLLNKLGNIYYKITGHSAGLRTSFINFAFECLNHIEKSPHSWDSLKQRIRILQPFLQDNSKN